MDEMILASWQRLVPNQLEIDLLSMYRGMPVIHKAQVQYVDEATVYLIPQSFKSICLTLNKTVIALSELFDEPLSAEIKEVDLKEGKVVLENFTYVSGHLGDRMSPRVEPREPIAITLETGGRAFPGHVMDLSISGIGVFVAGEEIQKLRTRSIVRFSLTLPEETIPMLGVIRHAKRTTQGSRLGIAFEPGINLRAVFTYINFRRTELMEELKILYETNVP